jgi:host factor-I protein
MEKHISQNIQDAFLNTARREKARVVFHMMSDKTLTGNIRSFDKFSVILDVNGQESLIFKHAISTISIEKKSTNNLQVKYLGRKTDNV